MNEWTCLTIIGVAAIFGLMDFCRSFRESKQKEKEIQMKVDEINRLADEVEARLEKEGLDRTKKGELI